MLSTPPAFHPEPGSPLIKCLIFLLKITVWLSLVLLLLVCLNRSLNVKKFSRIVCSTLFSYQRFVVSVSQTVSRLFYLISFFVCQALFKFFSNIFELRDFIVVSLTTWILYHIFCLLSTVNFIFSEILFNCLFFKNNYFATVFSYITIGFMLVNHKIQFFQIFLEVYL